MSKLENSTRNQTHWVISSSVASSRPREGCPRVSREKVLYLTQSGATNPTHIGWYSADGGANVSVDLYKLDACTIHSHIYFKIQNPPIQPTITDNFDSCEKDALTNEFLLSEFILITTKSLATEEDISCQYGRLSRLQGSLVPDGTDGNAKFSIAGAQCSQGKRGVVHINETLLRDPEHSDPESDDAVNTLIVAGILISVMAVVIATVFYFGRDKVVDFVSFISRRTR